MTDTTLPKPDRSEAIADGALPEAFDRLGLLEALLATSQDCIKVLDRQGRVLFVNRGGEVALELDAAGDVVGRLWPDFWTGSDRHLADEALEKARRGETCDFLGEAETMKGSPRCWHVTVAPIPGPQAGMATILVQSRDLSSSRIAEERIAALAIEAQGGARELRASEEKFRTIADTMPQMVWSTLPDGFHDYFNARWYEFTGVPAGSTDGEGWNDLFHPDDRQRAFELWRRSLETGEPYEIEYRLRHHSGEYRWTLGRALPIRDGSGRITRWFGTCTDIHAAKRDAELLALLSQELSHRIKNIFAIVQGLIGISARKRPEMRAFASDLRDRVAALGRAHDFARPHSEASRPIVGETTLHALVREILKPYPAMEDGRIALIGEDLPVDDKAATPIGLLIHELATNAMKYGALSVDQGVIRIETSVLDGTCALTWRERGGPRIDGEPTHSGFGMQLANSSVDGHLGGTIMRIWEPDGLVVSVACPVSSLLRR